MNKITFKSWLKTQRKRDDAIGDLARDVKADRRFPKTNTYKACKRYLERVNACREAMIALDKAWKEYEKSIKKEESRINEVY